MSINPAYRLMHGRAIIMRPTWHAPDPPTSPTGEPWHCDCRRDGDPLGAAVPQSPGAGEARPKAPEVPPGPRPSRRSALQREVSPYLQRRLRSLEEVLRQRADPGAAEED